MDLNSAAIKGAPVCSTESILGMPKLTLTGRGEPRRLELVLNATKGAGAASHANHAPDGSSVQASWVY